jgi:hypothetical protein
MNKEPRSEKSGAFLAERLPVNIAKCKLCPY